MTMMNLEELRVKVENEESRGYMYSSRASEDESTGGRLGCLILLIALACKLFVCVYVLVVCVCDDYC
jgi:hypothetical protein